MKVVDNILFFNSSEERENARFLINIDDVKHLFISDKQNPLQIPIYVDMEMLDACIGEATYFTFEDIHYVIIDNEIIYLCDLEIMRFKHSSTIELTMDEIIHLVNNGYDNIEETWQNMIDDDYGYFIFGSPLECKNADVLLDAFGI